MLEGFWNFLYQNGEKYNKLCTHVNSGSGIQIVLELVQYKNDQK